MKVSQVKHTFYYLYDERSDGEGNNVKGYPIVTVCLGQHPESGKFSRGFAICSPLESLITRREGRNWALARMLRANGTGRSSEPLLNQVALGRLDTVLHKEGPSAREVTPLPVIDVFEYHSSHGVHLTDFEMSVFIDPKEAA